MAATPTMNPSRAFPGGRAPHSPPSIEDYAAIGNCRSLALVSRQGSIDWWCLPHFSGASVFAALLDAERGGRFAVMPRGTRASAQHYEPSTNVLVTRFECEGGVLELTDFMTLPETDGLLDTPDMLQQVVRIARCVAGEVDMDVLFQPRPDYARRVPAFTRVADGHWRCPGTELGSSLSLHSSVPLQCRPGDALTASARLREGGEELILLLHTAHLPPDTHSAIGRVGQMLDDTRAWWRNWCSGCTYRGRHVEAVLRSALALKLLTHRPTGAVVAAGTTSLPESESGHRNWDYRYCWLRDTSLVLDAFTDLGFTAESEAFFKWLLHATQSTRPRLQVMYDVHGRSDLPEYELPHLRGWHGIGPVRIGNAAAGQVQLDVYGEIVFTAWDYVEAGHDLDDDEKDMLSAFVGRICDIWRQPDHGIWEIRLPKRHNTHSKILCWTALDRARRMAESQGLPIDAAHVRRERDALREDIEAHGFNEGVNSYVGYYGSEEPDAALLVIPRMGYLPADHPRMLGTIAYVHDQLQADGLLYRYRPGPGYDGVEGSEHLLAICSFWYVDCLARLGRLDEADALFDRLLALRNPVGLYAEEFKVEDGQPMGNFPQAFSHVGLITAAHALWLARRRGASPATGPV